VVRIENVEIHLEVNRKGRLFIMWAVPAHNGAAGGGTDQVVNLLSYVNTQILTSYG